jgi:Outer membrane efflux protein
MLYDFYQVLPSQRMKLMKGLSVLKKLYLLCSLLLSSVYADELSNVLSDNKNILFDYEFQSNTAQSDMLQNSWINPIMLQYSKTYSEQFSDRTTQTGSFTVGIDQPIFRSGGIYFAIKYSQALRGANEAEIKLKKREMIGSAVKLLFEMKKLKLEKKKLALLIKNDAIDIRQKRESYEAGLIDSSFLDQAILKQNQDETNLLEMEMSEMKLEQSFTLLSDKDPNTLKLPKLKLISVERYKGTNLELTRDKLRAKEKGYNAKMTWAKYLPTVSLQGRYSDSDLNPLYERPGLEEKYYTYGFTVSMPLNINMFSDVEASKVAHLKAQTEVIERKQTIDTEYKLIKSKLRIIEKKITLAHKDEKLYNRLYKTTKNLAKAGEKTSFDTAMMRNSLQVRKLDQKIYRLDKQIELIGLYTKVANVNAI